MELRVRVWVCGCEYVIYTHYKLHTTHNSIYVYIYTHTLLIYIYTHTPSTRTHNHLAMVCDIYKCICVWCAMCINGIASGCVGAWVCVCNVYINVCEDHVWCLNECEEDVWRLNVCNEGGRYSYMQIMCDDAWFAYRNISPLHYIHSNVTHPPQTHSNITHDHHIHCCV